jgi:hypothetical protein
MHNLHEKNYNIIIFAERDQNMNEEDDNVDVEIVMNNGERYSGTIFTLKNIETLMKEYKQTGECCKGLFFGGCKDLVIVERLNFEVIANIVESVFKEGEIETVFSRLT